MVKREIIVSGSKRGSFKLQESIRNDIAALAKALPPGAAAGERYPEAALAHMDSEKRRPSA